MSAFAIDFLPAQKATNPTGRLLQPKRRMQQQRTPNCLQDKTVVVITSGANMNFDRLRLVSELADIGALREAMLATTIPESPGSFREFIDIALSDTTQSVTEFKYR